MKRALVLILILCTILSSAYAESTAYVCNPDPSDRLHLRAEANPDSPSLGKYYNGTEVTVLRTLGNGWAEVIVGKGSGSLQGFMMTRFLSAKAPEDARPQFASSLAFKTYVQPVLSTVHTRYGAGELVSLLGFTPEWHHIMIHLKGRSVTCFVPASITELTALDAQSAVVNAYVSNPDSSDRLHLRTEPAKNSESLGKYYNGSVGKLMGFTPDGGWLKVDLYGRTGYMDRSYITIEGKTNYCMYGIPSVKPKGSAPVLYLEYPVSSASSKGVTENAEIEVLGLVNEEWLHVRADGETGYMLRANTTYIDPKE